MADTILTQEKLRAILHYEPVTGLFTWRVRLHPRSKRRAGDIAGSRDRKTSRLYITIYGRSYAAYRLAFLYMTGNWPLCLVDHKDTDPSNDVWDNLREADHIINAQNQRKALARNKLGILGVCYHKNRYQASIFVDGKEKHLGRFDTAEEASASYVSAKRKFHQGCTI